MARPALQDNLSPPQFLQFNSLACETAGGKVIFATDEWFAPARNLLKRDPPEFLPSAFTDFGKWMDGWETRRKRKPGHDWCLVQLGVPGVIHGVDVDTSFFTGNYAPHASIQAAWLDKLPALSLDGDRTGTAASESQWDAVAQLNSERWEELVPVTELRAGYADSCHNFLSVCHPGRFTHLRFNIYPDGGVARLRVYGVGQKDWSAVSSADLLDLVALVNGGVCVGYSDAHFGHPRNLIGIGRADNMGDGWETARRLDRPKVLKVGTDGILQVPGSEWAVFRLGHLGLISEIEVDTNHFKGNFPDSCRIDACTLTSEQENRLTGRRWSCEPGPAWKVLLPPQKLKPHHVHWFAGGSLGPCGPVSHVRLVIAPDGGVSRLRLWGRPVQDVPTRSQKISKL